MHIVFHCFSLHGQTFHRVTPHALVPQLAAVFLKCATVSCLVFYALFPQAISILAILVYIFLAQALRYLNFIWFVAPDQNHGNVRCGARAKVASKYC